MFFQAAYVAARAASSLDRGLVCSHTLFFLYLQASVY
jgi:hypothetical protein